MEVKLVAKTIPVVEGLDTAEDLISYCARVSNPNNQLNTETAGGLLKYCLKHKHFSIFETANLVMEIQTTRDISRQILRHRSFSFQEFSQRYASVDPEIVYREARIQDVKNKQNSIVCDDDHLCDEFASEQKFIFDNAIESYNNALEAGIAKEQARALLPEGLTSTRMYMNGTLRSWLHFCQVRCGVETQKECRLVAKECCKIIIEEFPCLKELMTPLLEDNYSAEK